MISQEKKGVCVHKWTAYKAFLIAFPFVLERNIKTDLFCFVVIHFLKFQGLPFAFLD